jgi:hypothetical protein
MSREARALTALRNQIDAAFPNRSRISDGGVADARHLKLGTSDHIPDRNGVFHARDFTHDPGKGFDSFALADRLLAAQDPRLKYLISNGRIGSGPAGVRPGQWRTYTGANKHNHHVHVSVVGGPSGDDDRRWANVALPVAVIKNTISETQEDDLTPEDRQLLVTVNAKLDNLLGQFGYTIEDGNPAWRGVDVWDGSKRKLTLLDVLRETHRELMQRIPGRAPTNDTLLGHVLNIARKVGADGR